MQLRATPCSSICLHATRHSPRPSQTISRGSDLFACALFGTCDSGRLRVRARFEGSKSSKGHVLYTLESAKVAHCVLTGSYASQNAWSRFAAENFFQRTRRFAAARLYKACVFGDLRGRNRALSFGRVCFSSDPRLLSVGFALDPRMKTERLRLGSGLLLHTKLASLAELGRGPAASRRIERRQRSV